MKKFTLSILGLLLANSSIYAQTAADWTKTDCASNTHTLFTYLNNEEVVIMEFAMGCGSCTDAATYLLNTKDKYAISNPGKVKVFYMDYWPGNDCLTDVTPVTSAYAFDGVFDHCLTEKDYYFTSTSSPMPGIAIAAGSLHQIIYQNNNFADDDTTAIELAITTFFATASIHENSLSNSVIVSPNPSNGLFQLNFENSKKQQTKVSLFNINGQLISELLNEELEAGNIQKSFDLNTLPKGMYYINISNPTVFINKKIIVL